ncbi:MAG: radical SAM protein [Bdellovibrionales bacterium]|nr:radical SAM protein [Bdellovibrionales bacterium]
MMKINEIFYSIQGESGYIGYPTVFVRTSGCHLRCTYCDTQYAYHEGQKQSVDDILTEIQKFPAQYICITGGEPLLQNEVYSLMKKLCDLNYKVSLETSGDIDCKDVDVRVKKVIDIKTPDSGAFGAFDEKNLSYANVNTEFKFIICSKKDLIWAEEFSKTHSLFEKSCVLYSPSYKIVDEQWLASQILEMRSLARFQFQLHKYLWPSTQRGV